MFPELHPRNGAVMKGEKIPVVSLSPRQHECLTLVAQGKSDWEIAQILGISRDTVHEYVEAARQKYGVRRRIQLILKMIQDGHFDVDELV